MKRSFLGKRAAQTEEMSLQITSMADIFIIVLVFLLKSYSSGAMTVAPSANGLSLPSASAQDQFVEALKVEISETSVQVEGKPAAELVQFKFKAEDLQAGGISKTLGHAIAKQREKQLLIAKSNADVKVDSKILILSDQRTPYATVKSVLASVAIHGYTDFKLAVVKGD